MLKKPYKQAKDISSSPLRAAEYVRMSTEHQRYSTDIQSKAIREYAAQHNFEIVRTYMDEGKSGLNIGGREGLRQLISDAERGDADFAVILVYDVSRWGRFQNADESAFYEYQCRRAGIRIEYCAEHFDNDGSMGSDLLKALKRKSAGDYSRELSEKVFAGQALLIGKGYRQGGRAGYGLRRLLVDEAGKPKMQLQQGERKSIQTDRVILIPGPEAELAIVRRIYRLFIESGLCERKIAALLNHEGIGAAPSHPWTYQTIHQVLINEKYIGNNVWNRVSFKLRQRFARNDPSVWIRAADAFQPIISRTMFEAARAIIEARAHRPSSEEMLEALRRTLDRHGHLSGIIIDKAENCPSRSALACRFGSLIRSYSLIGYKPDRDYRYFEVNRVLRTKYLRVEDDVLRELNRIGASVQQSAGSGLLRINDEFVASLILSRCRLSPTGLRRWLVRLDRAVPVDIIIIVRMAPGEQEIHDYYLLPTYATSLAKIRLTDENRGDLDIYRYSTLQSLLELAKRTQIKEIQQ